MSNVTTTEPSVEQALAELKELFPKAVWVEVARYYDSKVGDIYRIEIADTTFEGRVLAECMACVRQWREQQEQK